MIELIWLFFALCFIAVPWASIGFLLAAVLTIALKLYYRSKDLEQVRKELGDLTGQTGHEVAALKRQVQSLTEQLAVLRTTGVHVDKPAAQEKQEEKKPEVHAPAAVPSREVERNPPLVMVTPAEATKPVASVTPVEPIRVEVPAASHLTELVTPLPPPPPPVAAEPVVPPKPHEVPIAARHEAPAIVPEPPKAPEAPKPAEPPKVVTPVFPPPLPPVDEPQHVPPPPPPPPPMAQPPVQKNLDAHIHEAQKQAALRQPPPVAHYTQPRVAAPPAKPKVSLLDRIKWLLAFEDRLGSNWFAKIGIVLVVFGLASWGITNINKLGAGGLVALLYVIGGAMLGAGIFAERKELYVILGRVSIGGGWALIFFTTFAMYYVPPMHVIDSRLLDLVFVLAAAAAMVVHTLRYRSQLVTGFAFLLAYSTIALSQNEVYSLTAGVILALGIVIIAGLMNWFELEVFGILSSYLAHMFWLYKLLGGDGAHGTMFPEFYPSTVILLFYWITYRVSYLTRKIGRVYEEHVSSVAAVLNTGLLLTVLKFQSVHKDMAFFALLALGALELIFGQLPVTRKRRYAFILLTVLGASLMVAAVPFRYASDPGQVEILWLLGAEVFLVTGVVQREVVFRRVGKVIGLAVSVHMAFLALPEIVKHGWPLHDSSAELVHQSLTFLVVGVAFYANYLFGASRWKEYFAERIDERLSALLSYVGCAALVVGLWAVLTPPWALVGFTALMAALAYFSRRFAIQGASTQSVLLGAASMAWAIYLFSYQGEQGLQYFTVPAFALAAAFFYAAAWQIWSSAPKFESTVRALATWAGTLLLALLIHGKVHYGWREGVVLLLAAGLTEVGARLQYRPLVWQVHVLALWAVGTGICNDYTKVAAWHQIEPGYFTPVVTAILLYWLAKRTSDIARQAAAVVRDIYLWAGTAVVAFFIGRESWAAHPYWMACEWLGYGIALLFVAHRAKLASLCHQERMLAALAVFWTIGTLDSPDVYYGSVSARLLTVSLMALGLYAASRFSSLVDGVAARWSAYLHTSAATALLAALAWYQAPQYEHAWFAVLIALFALILAAIDRRFEIPDLGWQSQALMVVAFFADCAIDLPSAAQFHGVSIRLLASLAVIASLYISSTLLRFGEQARKLYLDRIYTWAAAGLGGLLIWFELQPHRPEWIAVAWLGFGIILTLVGRWRKREDLCWQENIFALAAVFSLLNFNFQDLGSIGPVSVRLLTVSLVAAGLYFASRQSYVVENAYSRFIAYGHTWAATIALAVLAHEDAPDVWLPAVLATFALLLAAVDWRFKTAELKWQAHGLAAAAVAFVLFNDIPVMQSLRAQGKLSDLTAPFLASLAVALVLYLLSALLRFTDEQRKQNVHHIYTWVASALASALIWYGVSEVGVAVGWAVFGLALFWVGLHYRISNLRWQAYVALVSSFARIFFVDLKATPYTVMMVAAILYFVHIILKNETDLAGESRLKMSGFLAYLGTAAIGALCYEQLTPEKAPMGWAVMVVLLLGAMLWQRNKVYLHQALLLALGISGYGIVSYFNETRSVMPLVIAIAVLLLSLPMAYPLRELGAERLSSNRLARLAQAFAQRPEQVIFFSAIALLTFIMRHFAVGWATFGWGIEGIIIYIIALLLKETYFRRTGMIVVLWSLGWFVYENIWHATSNQVRIMTCIVLGVMCILISVFYNRYREKFKEWL